MKRLLLTLAFLTTATMAFAGGQDLIREQMESYWAALQADDFRGAAEYMYPGDLDDAKEALLPVFLEASKIPELREGVEPFFAGIPEGERETMTPHQVFAGVTHFAFFTNPQIGTIIKGCTITPTTIEMTAEDSATLSYDMSYDGQTRPGMETFKKVDGRWYLRAKESPWAVARKIRTALGL